MPNEPFIGEFMMFAGNFPPRGWAFCDGQLLAINQNQALFSILGTTYGGNGTTNFALPNLQSRLTLHQGQGPGLSLYDLGEMGGEETHTLLATEGAAHIHAINALNSGNSNGTNVPSDVVMLASAFAAEANNPAVPIYSTTAPSLQMAAQSVGPAGGGAPHNNLMPFVVLSWCIALQGIFPARN